MNRDAAGGDGHAFATAGQLVGPLPVDVHGRMGGRNLVDLADETFQGFANGRFRRRLRIEGARDLPSGSSVVLLAPSMIRAAYRLGWTCT